MCFTQGVGDYELLGSTLDDSVGEAYDKVARMLDISSSRGVHGGRLIEEMAARGNDRAFPFTEPMKHRKVQYICGDWMIERSLAMLISIQPGLRFLVFRHQDGNAA